MELGETLAETFLNLVAILESEPAANPLFLRVAYWHQYSHLHKTTVRLNGVGSLLDWGAGVGHFSFVQSALGADVTAYTVGDDDCSPYAAVLASTSRRTGVHHSCGMDPVLLPFASETFDTVVSCGVLEHVREFGGDEFGSLSEIYRILRPGGRFICYHLPRSHSPSEDVRRRLGRPHHRYTYSSRKFIELAESAGLQVSDHTRYGVLPWNTLARMVNRRVKWLSTLDTMLSTSLPLATQNHGFICTKEPTI